MPWPAPAPGLTRLSPSPTLGEAALSVSPGSHDHAATRLWSARLRRVPCVAAEPPRADPHRGPGRRGAVPARPAPGPRLGPRSPAGRPDLRAGPLRHHDLP